MKYESAALMESYWHWNSKVPAGWGWGVLLQCHFVH